MLKTRSVRSNGNRCAVLYKCQDYHVHWGSHLSSLAKHGKPDCTRRNDNARHTSAGANNSHGSAQHHKMSQDVTMLLSKANVEVVSVPGASSRLSLVRPARPKPIAPKVASPVLPPPPVSTQPQQQDPPHYIYTYGNTSQPQVIYQPMNPEYAIYTVGGASKQKAYQVQTAGLFYPAPASDGKQEPSVPQQVVIAQPPVQPPPPPPGRPEITKTTAMAHSATGPRRNTNPRRRASSKLNRVCALCGKEATYLCSGCHAEWYCGRTCQVSSKTISRLCNMLVFMHVNSPHVSCFFPICS